MAQKKLPVLPHGQGSMNYINGGIDIRYRKNIKLEDGSIIRISVTAKTAYDCMKLMAEKEQETKRGYIPNYKQTLYDI